MLVGFDIYFEYTYLAWALARHLVPACCSQRRMMRYNRKSSAPLTLMIRLSILISLTVAWNPLTQRRLLMYLEGYEIWLKLSAGRDFSKIYLPPGVNITFLIIHNASPVLPEASSEESALGSSVPVRVGRGGGAWIEYTCTFNIPLLFWANEI